MTNFDYDLQYIQAALEQLESYLLSDQLFWPVNVSPPAGQPSYPKLTAGNLLLALKRLQSSASTPGSQAVVRKLDDQVHALTTHWQSAWQKKIEHEYTSRMHQWGRFLQELENDPEKQAPYYHTEVRLRLLLDLLAEESDQEMPMTISYDAMLKQFFESGESIWDDDDSAAFPKGKYWYLYGHINPDL